MMNKFFIAALFSSLILSSCTVFFPLNIAFPDQLMNQSIRGKIFNETPTYAGLEPDSLKTRDDVNDTFMNDNTVSFTTKNDGDTWIFEWEADQGNARNNKPLPLPKTLSFHFEGDSVVSWESEGIKLNALTKKERILIGFLVGLGLDVGVILIGLANWSPWSFNFNSI